MGTYTLPKNTVLDVGLEEDYLDNGWVIYSGVAEHSSCNEGSVVNNNFISSTGQEYKITYTVTNYQSGEVYVILGGTQGQHVTSNGTFTETIVASNSSALMFWSNGDLIVSNVIISSGVVGGTTLAFNQRNLKFTGYYSFMPDWMVQFLDNLYTFKNGTLWHHDVNEERNTFYGESYPSIITFYLNVEPTKVKTLYSMRLNGNLPWNVTDITIEPRVGKSQGQKSRIKKGNFKNLQGQWFADFLRDMNDPRFGTELDALMNGAVLQGQIAKITIETNETKEVRLVSVDILESDQQYSY